MPLTSHMKSLFLARLDKTKWKEYSRDWSNLPLKAMTQIAENLIDGDYWRFRAVCKRWRSIPPRTFLLYDFLPEQFQSNSCSLLKQVGRPVYLVPTECYKLELLDNQSNNSSKPWLVSVEELNTRKLQFLLPLQSHFVQKLPRNFPKSLNFFDIDVLLMGEGGMKFCYDDGDEDVFAYDHSSSWRNYCSKNKVIIGNIARVGELKCFRVMVLLINNGGILVSLHLGTGHWSPISYQDSCLFDDIVKFHGHGCAIDRKGRAFRIDSNTLKVTDVLAGEPICDACITERRKLLAMSDDNELYMICRMEHTFRVYKLDESLHEWSEVDSLGDRILFVSYSDCFVVYALEFPGCRGNCIVFPKDCFPDYCSGECPADDEVFEGASKYIELGVCYLDNKDGCCEPISSYPELSELFWPPPSWIQSLSSTSVREVGEQAQSRKINSDDAPKASTERPMLMNYSRVPKDLQDDSLERLCDGPIRDSITGFSNKVVSQEPSAVDSGVNAPSVDENGGNRVSCEEFQGITVSSDLVPILQKLWDKHGNITEGHTAHSDGLLTWALETLANMIVILQTESGSSLTDSQTKYLTSSLLDLQSLHFRVDWLSPFVNRAVALHKEKEQKQRTISELESEKTKLLADLREVVDRLVQQRKLVADQTLEVSLPLLNINDVLS